MSKNHWVLEASKRIRLLSGLGILWGSFFGYSLNPRNAQAQVNTPALADGQYLVPSEAPCVPTDVDESTGTTESLVRGSGPGYVAWVVLSTAPADGTGWLVLKDSSTVNNTGLKALGGNLMFASATENTIYVFNPPMRFANGLTAKKSLAGTKASVCTRLYGTQIP